jgi:hypothetical protein
MSEKKQVEVAVQPVGTPVEPTQPVETNAYVPTYRIKPELKTAVLKVIGKYPFNQIAGIMNAINVEVMDHTTLTQIINVLGQFPYQDVHILLSSVNDYITQVVDPD